jgi:hypothetical protein
VHPIRQHYSSPAFLSKDSIGPRWAANVVPDKAAEKYFFSWQNAGRFPWRMLL